MKNHRTLNIIFIGTFLILIAFILYAIYGPTSLDRFKSYLIDSDKVNNLVSAIQRNADKLPHDRELKINELTPDIAECIDPIYLDAKLEGLTITANGDCNKISISMRYDNHWTFDYNPCADKRPVYNYEPVVDGMFEYYTINQYWSAYVDNDWL